MKKKEPGEGEPSSIEVVFDEIEEYRGYQFNGKPVKSRFALFFLNYLFPVVFYSVLVVLSPLWAPVHLICKVLNKRGVIWREGDDIYFKFLGVNLFWRRKETIEIVGQDKNLPN